MLDSTGKVRFSEEQLRYLEQRFPEPVINPKNYDTNTVMYQAGARAVVELVRNNQMHVRRERIGA